MAAQRESKLQGEVEVCAKALQQRTWLVYALPDATFRVSCVLLDWVNGLLMCVASNVMVLSSIKIGAPASSEGT
jgi:hypothetical protein